MGQGAPKVKGRNRTNSGRDNSIARAARTRSSSHRGPLRSFCTFVSWRLRSSSKAVLNHSIASLSHRACTFHLGLCSSNLLYSSSPWFDVPSCRMGRSSECHHTNKTENIEPVFGHALGNAIKVHAQHSVLTVSVFAALFEIRMEWRSFIRKGRQFSDGTVDTDGDGFPMV